MSEREPGSSTPSIIPRPEHPISRSLIAKEALKVLYRLNDQGYRALLVGGSVRDLLLGLHPKDFDVATDATPEQVRGAFRNCRLVGRRFRLAHVHFGRDFIEVATFRAGHDPEDADDQEGVELDDDGRILRDNRYGTLEEDAFRRDFTINALYYDIADYSVVDYTGGMADLEARQVRLIGDPERRYREDPVRMLRAVRFASKLLFEIEPGTAAPIVELAPLLEDIPPARLFDESLKLFLSGHGARSYHVLEHFGLLDRLFPVGLCAGEGADEERAFILSALDNTDARVRIGKPVTPAFLFAALLWGPVRREAARLRDEGVPPTPALTRAARRILDEQTDRVAIPRRFTTPMIEIYTMQERLQRTQGKRVLKTLSHPRFRAAYDFLLLRAQSGEVEQAVADFWTELQETPEGDRAAKVGGGKGERSGKGRRRKRGGRRRGGGRGGDDGGGD